MRALFKRPRKDSTVLKLAALAIILLDTLLLWATDNEIYTLGMHTVRILAAIGMLWGFRGHWMPVWNAERIGKVDIMATAVFLWGISVIFHAGYSLAWRVSGRPDSMMSSDWNTVGYTIGIIALVMMQASQRNDENELPRANVVYTILIFIIGITVGAFGAIYHDTVLASIFPINNSIGF